MILAHELIYNLSRDTLVRMLENLEGAWANNMLLKHWRR